MLTTTKTKQIWIFEDSPVAAGEIKIVKETNKDGWFFTVDKKLIDPHWCCLVGDWQTYNGGFALFSQETGELVEERDIKNCLLQAGDWIDEVQIAAELFPLRTDLVKQWLRSHQEKLVEMREVRDGREWRLKSEDALPEPFPAVKPSVAVTNGEELRTIEKLCQLEQEILDTQQIIVNGFYQIGICLRQIRDERLYELKNYKSFQEYAQSELNFTRRYAAYTIDAACIVEEIRPSMKQRYSISTELDTNGTNGSKSTELDTNGTNGSKSTELDTNGTNGSNEVIELKERHLRPLIDPQFDLTPEERCQIWERVELELEDLREKQKPPKLTAKLVEKAIAEYKQALNNMPPLTFESGQICKVKLGVGIGEKTLAPYDGKLVRVVSQMTHSVKCKGFWGEEIEDYFHPDELTLTEETEFYRQSVTLPVGLLKELAKRGQSIEDAIANLLGQ